MADEPTFRVPHEPPEHAIHQQAGQQQLLAMLDTMSDAAHENRHQVNDTGADLSIVVAVNRVLARYAALEWENWSLGRVILLSAAGSAALAAGDYADYWQTAAGGPDITRGWKFMTNYDTIIIPYGGIDVAFGCHRSCFVATQPWSPNTAARRIWHLDSKGLTSCHGTQQVGKKVMGALCWVRTAMCMPEVAYTINAVPVPPELNCAHSSAFNCAFNVACLLDVMANDTEIIISAYKTHTIEYDPAWVLAVPQQLLHMLQPTVEACPELRNKFEAASWALPCDGENLYTDHWNLPLAAHICKRLVAGLPALYLRQEPRRRRSRSHSCSPASQKPKYSQCVPATAHEDDGYDDAGMPPAEPAPAAARTAASQGARKAAAKGAAAKAEAKRAKAEAKGAKAEAKAAKRAKAAAKGAKAAAKAAATAAGRSPATTGNPSAVDMLTSLLCANDAMAPPATAEAPGAQSVLDLGGSVLAELRQISAKLDQVVSSIDAVAAQQAAQQLAAQAAADPGSLKRLAQQVIADEPYPDELILIGAVLQHHEVGSMEALLEKLHQDSAKAIKVVKSTRTELKKAIRHERGNLRIAAIQGLCSVLGVPYSGGKDPGIDAVVCERLLADGTYDNLNGDPDNEAMGAGAYNSPELLGALLSAYNYIHGTNLADFGAGALPTQVSYGLLAQVLMETRRFLQGAQAAAPTTGAAGNTLAAAHDELDELHVQCRKELDEATKTASFNLEAANNVTLITARVVGSLRAIGRRTDAANLKKLGVTAAVGAG